MTENGAEKHLQKLSKGLTSSRSPSRLAPLGMLPCCSPPAVMAHPLLSLTPDSVFDPLKSLTPITNRNHFPVSVAFSLLWPCWVLLHPCCPTVNLFHADTGAPVSCLVMFVFPPGVKLCISILYLCLQRNGHPDRPCLSDRSASWHERDYCTVLIWKHNTNMISKHWWPTC